MTATGAVIMVMPEQGLAEFERNAGRFVSLLTDAELDAKVPSCPGWRLTDTWLADVDFTTF